MNIKQYKEQLTNYLKGVIAVESLEETSGQAKYDFYVSKPNFNFDLAIQHRTNAFKATVRREFCEELIDYIKRK